MTIFIIGFLILFNNIVQAEDNNKVSEKLTGLCYVNIDSSHICDDTIKSLVRVNEPIGGLDDTKTEEIISKNSVGEPVQSVYDKIPDNIPDIVVLPPIVCPHYTQYYKNYHRGVDLVNKKCNGNDWVVAVNSGTVTFTGWLGGYGNRVEVDHGNGFVTTYSHLSAINTKVGEKVSVGQKLGVLGTTGRSTGIHLHFEVIYNGIKINPVNLINK